MSTKLILQNSQIHSENLSQEFFLSLGVSAKNLSHLVLHNSSLKNVTFGEDLENLRTLDLRNNYFVDVFTEIRLISLEDIFLSGKVNLFSLHGIKWSKITVGYQETSGPVSTPANPRDTSPSPASSSAGPCPGCWRTAGLGGGETERSDTMSYIIHYTLYS